MKKALVLFLSVLVMGDLICPGKLEAQMSRSLWFMDHLPAASSLNPAYSPQAKVVVDLPLISSTNLSVDAPFSWSEITQRNINDDQLVLNKSGIVSSMDEVGLVGIKVQTMMGKLGIRSGRHFFTFDVSKIFNTDVSLERELVEFLLYGNAHSKYLGQELQFSETGFKTNFYHEFALGYSIDLNPKLSFGVRAKYLNGILNAWTERANVNIYTDPEDNYSLSASTDILLRTAAAFDYLEDLNLENPMDYIMVRITDNHGFAADLGMRYRPVEKLEFSASVQDLGTINWKTNARSYRSEHANETFTFSGLEMSEFLNNGSLADSISVLDTLDKHFNLESFEEPYNCSLTASANLGGAYNLTNNDQFGLLIRAYFPQGQIRTTYTLNYRRTFGDVFTGVVNYTFTDRGAQIGMGLSVRAGAVTLYAMTDAFRSMIEPATIQAFNAHFGMSLAFGRKKKNDIDVDVPDPMIPPETDPEESTGTSNPKPKSQINSTSGNHKFQTSLEALCIIWQDR
jgi:hypothetical protein